MNLINNLKIPPINYIFFIFLTCMPNLMSIGLYLLFSPSIIVNHKKNKNFNFKYLIDDIVIDLWLPWNYTRMDNKQIWHNPMTDLLKFASNR